MHQPTPDCHISLESTKLDLLLNHLGKYFIARYTMYLKTQTVAHLSCFYHIHVWGSFPTLFSMNIHQTACSLISITLPMPSSRDIDSGLNLSMSHISSILGNEVGLNSNNPPKTIARNLSLISSGVALTRSTNFLGEQ